MRRILLSVWSVITLAGVILPSFGGWDEAIIKFSRMAQKNLPKHILNDKNIRIVSGVEDLNGPQLHQGKGFYLFDADEVLYTHAIDKQTGKPTRVLLSNQLEALLKNLRANGHEVWILTYNYTDKITGILKDLGVDMNLFHGVISCEMNGDVFTEKGNKLRQFVKQRPGQYQFMVFIDNFGPFLADVKGAADDLKLPFYGFYSVGYENHYYEYVYHTLLELQKGVAQKDKSADAKLALITQGLAKFGIDIHQFDQTFPTLDAFKSGVKGLEWPYLTYW